MSSREFFENIISYILRCIFDDLDLKTVVKFQMRFPHKQFFTCLSFTEYGHYRISNSTDD